MHATDTRTPSQQDSQQTDLRAFGFVTADQLRLGEDLRQGGG
jgi:hypothetical protein